MKRYILTSIAICMTLLSCEKTFLLTVDGSNEHKMNLFCATGAIDSTVISLEAVAAAIPDPLPDPKDAEIVFKVRILIPVPVTEYPPSLSNRLTL